MKRLLLVGILVALVPAAVAKAWPGEKAIVAERKHAAGRAAAVLLRSFVPPRKAIRLRHAPDLPAGSWPGSSPFAKFATRQSYWRTRAPLDTVAAHVRAHGPRGLALQPTASGPGYRILEFASGGRRYLVITLLRHEGVTLVRVQADVVWMYPRSPQEKVPANVRVIDIEAPRGSRHVTNSEHVATIVKWFDALPISPPNVAATCLLIDWPLIRFVFRSANGRRLASASAPPVKAGMCSAISFSIHGKRQQPLVDTYRGPGFVYRVGKLLGMRLTLSRR